MKFHSGEIAVQERAGVRHTAEDVGEMIRDRVAPGAQQFLALRRVAVLGTVDVDGSAWASVVTGEPGFIATPDAQTITIRLPSPFHDPLIDNLAVEGHIALFAPDFVAPRRIRLNGHGRIKEGRIWLTTDEVYGNCKRYIQERIIIGARSAPASEDPDIVSGAVLSPVQQVQIAQADTFFIATDHPEHGADVSHKGGRPGFVQVIDRGRLAFPDYNGNSMFNTLGNLTVNPRAGLLFIDFANGRTLQLAGAAAIDWDPARARIFAGAERVVDFAITQVIDNPVGFPLTSKFRQFSRYNP
jgi:predicted pyridoxine 5'-phosphate oxidase superfamily flavin-nucleotide-binding protein